MKLEEENIIKNLAQFLAQLESFNKSVVMYISEIYTKKPWHITTKQNAQVISL